MKKAMKENAPFGGPSPGSPDAKIRRLTRMPREIREIREDYYSFRPDKGDDDETRANKQRLRDEAFDKVLRHVEDFTKQMGTVFQYALAVGVGETDFFNSRHVQVAPLDPCRAEQAPAISVPADPELAEQIAVGDVILISGDGKRVIDIEENYPLSGLGATVVDIQPDQAWPYELAVEDGYNERRMYAKKRQRLERQLAVGDRVRVAGGFIHDLLPKKATGGLVMTPRQDLELSDLHGEVPRTVLAQILCAADKKLHPERYPACGGRFDNNCRLLLFGPPGVGKTFTFQVAASVLHKTYNSDGEDKIVFIMVEGSAVQGSLVGSGPRKLGEIRRLAKQVSEEGKVPVVFINEVGSLLRSREIQNQMLDGGSSLDTHEALLSMTSGPDEIPGVLIVDLNLEKLMDEATRQRFTCIGFPHIDRLVFTDRMFQAAWRKYPDLFSEDWEAIRSAVGASMETTVGTVMVGSDTVEVKTENLISGRMFDQAMTESLRMVDFHIFTCRQRDLVPLHERISAPILYYALTRRAWSLFKCWDDSQAQERLASELARAEKAGAIARPVALRWDEIDMPEDLDCRSMLENAGEELSYAANY